MNAAFSKGKGSRFRQTALIASILILPLIVIFILSFFPRNGPNVQLKQVLSRIRPTGLDSDQEYSYWQTNADILNGLGSNVAPLIIQVLRCEDSHLKNWCRTTLSRLPFLRIRPISAEDRAFWLQITLEPGKPTSQGLASNLVQMLVLPDVQRRDLPSWSANHLAAIGEASVPPLIRALSSPDLGLRIAAVRTLSQFECESWNDNDLMIRDPMIGNHTPAQVKPEVGEMIVQALHRALKDSDSDVRSEAAKAIKRFQENNRLHDFAER